MKNSLLIKNGTVVDPASGECAVRDIVVQDGVIASVEPLAKSKKVPGTGRALDAAGMIVLPGLVDMHVHLREPGREDKETVASGSRAAVRGGITSVVAMPNTDPPPDTAQRVKALNSIIARSAHCAVHICGCMTEGRRGLDVVNVSALKDAGVVAISDDGNSVDADDVMLRSCAAARAAGVPVIAHAEDKRLSAKGVVNAGFISTTMGLRGISKESEYARVERDIRLAAESGAWIHIAHVSCAESVEIIAKAKQQGIRVSAETAPHYLALTEEAVKGFDPNYKMNPPLRGASDRDALKQGLRDGTIDVIATDHAPHTENEKEIEFERAEFGVIGLETALSVCVQELVVPGVLTWLELARVMAYNPARIVSIPAGTLAPGSVADIAIVSPGTHWVVRKETMVSKSKNSPFLNKELPGVISWVIRRGEIVYSASESCDSR
jgi:dihydroorotase